MKRRGSARTAAYASGEISSVSMQRTSAHSQVIENVSVIPANASFRATRLSLTARNSAWLRPARTSRGRSVLAICNPPVGTLAGETLWKHPPEHDAGGSPRGAQEAGRPGLRQEYTPSPPANARG